MNTRQRMEALRARQAAIAPAPAPVGMAVRAGASSPMPLPSWPQRVSFCAPDHHGRDGECVPRTCAPRAHPLADAARNADLAGYESAVRARFEAIVPALRELAARQHDSDFEVQAQRLAMERLGFELPHEVLADAWISGLDTRRLYGHCVIETYRLLAAAQREEAGSDAEVAAMRQFFIECGFHEVDISPCADGRLKGLLPFILRVPIRAVGRRKSYAGALFDVEMNVRHWAETELHRFREGVPTPADAPTRYLKVAVYHFSSSQPEREGCAAHGSDEKRAAQAALDRLEAFRTAIENGFCCGASVATLLIGVDTDNDAIRIHIPDGRGKMSVACHVDAIDVYRQTTDLAVSEARRCLAAAIDAAVRHADQTLPEPGMRRLIERLLTNNLSQIDYVCAHHGGRYADIGHAERLISIGDGFDELHLRNLAYFGHMYTLEEGASDMDVGIRIFTRLNVSRGLPIPVAIHYRYDERVPGSRDRAVERCRRVKRAILARYPDLAGSGLLYCAMSVQGRRVGSGHEPVSDSRAVALEH